MSFLKTLYGEYIFVLMVLLTGIGVSVATATSYQQHFQSSVLQSFEAAADDRIETIREFMSYNGIVLKSVDALYNSSDYVSHDEFTTFTSHILKDYPYLTGLGWLPHVENKDRAAFERKAREWKSDYTFTQKDADGNFTPEDKHDEYFPVYYSVTDTPTPKAMGYDIAQDADRSIALRAARDSHHMQASGLVHLLQESAKDHPKGVFFLMPVYKMHHAKNKNGDIRYEQLEGFVSTAVSLYKLIETALRPLQHSGVNILIHDLSATDPEKQLLYTRSTRLKDIPESEILEDFKNGQAMSKKALLDVAGRQWQITIQQARGFYSTQLSSGFFGILLGGILFTCLVAFYMIAGLRENERISIEVADRTEALSKAKKQTELILHSTHEGIIGLDTKGIITFCNPRSAALLGFAKRELVGSDFSSLTQHENRSDCDINRVLENGNPCSSSKDSFKNKAGILFPVDYTAAPIMDGDEVAGAVVIFHDITERKTFEKQLQHMAQYDQMTGLCNRRLFMDLLKGSLSRTGRAEKKVAVIYFDLNGFKQVNDELGHAAGDEMLKAFAVHLKNAIRDSDAAARLGGDEFAVLAENLGDKKECFTVVNRLLDSLNKSPVHVGSREIFLSTSIGIAFYPDDGDSGDSLLSHADSAMYKAKRDKKLPYAVYAKGDEARSRK